MNPISFYKLFLPFFLFYYYLWGIFGFALNYIKHIIYVFLLLLFYLKQKRYNFSFKKKKHGQEDMQFVR